MWRFHNVTSNFYLNYSIGNSLNTTGVGTSIAQIQTDKTIITSLYYELKTWGIQQYGQRTRKQGAFLKKAAGWGRGAPEYFVTFAPAKSAWCWIIVV